MGNFPQCERLAAHKNKMVVITNFVEWLQEGGIFLAEHTEHGTFSTNKKLEDLLYEYYSIDYKKLEEERVQILENQRALTEQREPPADS